MAPYMQYSVEKPLNREPPLKELVSSFLTTSGAYDRNHGPIPYLDANTHLLTIDGEVSNPQTLTVPQLRDNYPQHEVISALQCAGNRRHTMRTMLKEVKGLDWCDGAVMNCSWRGPRLRDVLLSAGVRDKASDSDAALHVAFSCYQTLCEDDSYYGGSVELERVMNPDAEVILALEMNGKPLHPNHGFPIRAVVPGVAGARWVKWLDQITIQPKESQNFYQQHDYKILPPEASTWAIAEDFWHRYPAMQAMPINSVVAIPSDGETVQLSSRGLIETKGFAVPDGDHGPVVRVEVSADDGHTWYDAELDNEGKHAKWSWVLWRATVPATSDCRAIFSRATDSAGNTQDQELSEWNIRGVGFNGWGAARCLTVIAPSDRSVL